MSKDKRSFFEKLSGVVRIEDDAPQFEEPTPARRGHHGHTTHEAPVEKEDWLQQEEETEGQLTVDVYQTPNEIVIRTMIAGVKPDDLDISITRDMVVIKGRREVEREVEDGDYFFRELYWGSFSRTVTLPQEIEVEEAEATERHGLLTIRLPKVDKGRQTKLKVRSA